MALRSVLSTRVSWIRPHSFFELWAVLNAKKHPFLVRFDSSHFRLSIPSTKNLARKFHLVKHLKKYLVIDMFAFYMEISGRLPTSMDVHQDPPTCTDAHQRLPTSTDIYGRRNPARIKNVFLTTSASAVKVFRPKFAPSLADAAGAVPKGTTRGC